MKRRRYILYRLVIAAGCLIFQFTGFAQSGNAAIQLSTDRNQVLIGEPIELKVKVQIPTEVPVTQFFNLPDTFNTLEVLQRGNMDSSVEAAFKIYTQTFFITGFDSGTWAVPPLVMQAGKKTLTSNKIDITVIPVPLPADSSYHSIREIIEVEEIKQPWWYWLVGALAVAVVVALLYWWIKLRKTKAVAPAEKTVDPGALQDALNKLKQLELQQLPENGEWKKYYSTLTDITKVYIEKRFGRPAASFTTDELLVFADGYLQKEKTALTAETLRIADAVKFAKYQPGLAQSATDIKTIEDSLRQMDKKNS